MEAIRHKIEGEAISAPKEQEPAGIADLMDALKQSVALQKKDSSQKRLKH